MSLLEINNSYFMAIQEFEIEKFYPWYSICDLQQENIQQELTVQMGKTKWETNGKQTLRESVLML